MRVPRGYEDPHPFENRSTQGGEEMLFLGLFQGNIKEKLRSLPLLTGNADLPPP